jgi:molybdate transport system regulatory protein
MPDRPLVSLKLRLLQGDCFAMGPGKAALLEAIAETRSVAAAGRKLGLSYWKTRRLLEELNQCFRLPLVATTKGGDRGGGSRVTAAGQEALARFRAMEAVAGAAVAPQARAYQELLAPRNPPPE